MRPCPTKHPAQTGKEHSNQPWTQAQSRALRHAPRLSVQPPPSLSGALRPAPDPQPRPRLSVQPPTSPPPKLFTTPRRSPPRPRFSAPPPALCPASNLPPDAFCHALALSATRLRLSATLPGFRLAPRSRAEVVRSV